MKLSLKNIQKEKINLGDLSEKLSEIEKTKPLDIKRLYHNLEFVFDHKETPKVFDELILKSQDIVKVNDFINNKLDKLIIVGKKGMGVDFVSEYITSQVDTKVFESLDDFESCSEKSMLVQKEEKVQSFFFSFNKKHIELNNLNEYEEMIVLDNDYYEDLNLLEIYKKRYELPKLPKFNSPSEYKRFCSLFVSKAKKNDSSLSEEEIDKFYENNFREKITTDLCTVRKAKKTIDDLIVEDNIKKNLKLSINKITQFNKLSNLSENFLSKINLSSSNISMLMYGPPGVGKTLSAEVLAHSLGKELWVCDYSSLNSKYVGESEKNIKKLLKSSEDSGAVLVLDECDELLSSRKEGSSYRNGLTNMFLSLLEDYKGIIIFTTNHIDYIDEAILSRIPFKIQYNSLSKELQYELLENILKDAPVEKDINISQILPNIDLSGRDIVTGVNKAVMMMLSEDTEFLTEKQLKESFKSFGNKNATKKVGLVQ